MSKDITVNVRSNCGVDTVYPVCDLSKMLCELDGTRTMTAKMLSILRKNGYSVTATGYTPNVANVSWPKE